MGIRPLIGRLAERVAPATLDSYRERRRRRLLGEYSPTRFGFSINKAAPASTLRPGWEADEIRTLSECLNQSEVLVDIGANIGFYSCLAASAGKQVIAVEPISKNLQALYGNLLHNELVNVEVYPVALADKPGLREIFGRNDLASLVRGWHGGRNSEIVPVVTLDGLIAKRLGGRQVTIKMDVEGAEFLVLQGASDCLRMRPKPHWMVEVTLGSGVTPGVVNPHFADVFELFWSHGYRAISIGQDNTEVDRGMVNEWMRNPPSPPPNANFLFHADGLDPAIHSTGISVG